MTALLLATDHQYRDRLRAGGYHGHTPARSIGTAIDAIHAEPDRPHTLASLAATARITTRALRAEFRRQFGVTPTAYLRDVRLLAAHAELINDGPENTAAAEIARRWGFRDRDEFAARYRARFHVAPW